MKTPQDESNHRIIVIDDNPAIHEDFRKILSRKPEVSPGLDAAEAALFGEGHPVPEAASFQIDSAFQGAEGLAMVERALAAGRPYALAFVDVRMPPGWDGVETITQLWRSYPELQVVICTAYSDYSWSEITRHLGASEQLVILKKPFDNIEVLQLAHALTKKWLLAQQGKVALADLDQMVQKRTEELASANARLNDEIRVRHETQAALERSEERFEKAFRANPIAMAIQTFAEERYLDVNQSFVELCEFQPPELIGHSPSDLPSLLSPEVRSQVRRQLVEARSVRNFPCQVQTRSGLCRQALLWVELFNLGELPYMLVLVQDVTERVRLEQELRQTQKIEAVGRLSAGVAHDFNNILTVILGHVSLQLASERLEEDIKESLQAVETAAERASLLTRQLLAFGRKQAMHRKVVDVNQVIAHLRIMVSRVIGEHHTLNCAFESQLPEVLVDPNQLEEAVMNLVLNARDAMPDGGTLTLRTEVVVIDPDYVARHSEARVGSYVALSVMDTGCGMDAATKERIFEPFFTTKDVGKGSGMGLPMVDGILKQQGGWVEVTSRLNQGSTFKLFLPIPENQARENPASPANPGSTSATHKGSERILLVEDEPSVRALVNRILCNNGYRVSPAADGVEATAIWQREQGRFDLLVTDVVMPAGISGGELARRLRTSNPKLKVIYTTGYNPTRIGLEGELREGYDLLPKPYAPDKLLSTIRSRLAS